MSGTVAFIIAAIAFVGITVVLLIDKFNGSLNIKAKAVGDGQFGADRFSTEKEKMETYEQVPFEPEKWRKGIHLPTELQGTTVLGYYGYRGHVKAMVDTSDSHTIMIAPPGVGKTTCGEYPNLELSCARGLSFLCTDVIMPVLRRSIMVTSRM
jgi:type IV secretion system protein VirD4